MKKSFIYSMAALLVAGATFTACSSSENDIENGQSEQPKVFKMTVKATRDNVQAATRATIAENGPILNVDWEYEDVIYVFDKDGNAVNYEYSPYSQAYLQAYENGHVSKFEGDIPVVTGKVYSGADLILKFIPTPNYGTDSSKPQGGTLAWIAKNCQSAVAKVTLGNIYINPTEVSETARFESQQAIVKFILKNSDGSASVSATKLAVTVDGKTYTAATDGTFSEGVVFLAIPGFSNKTVDVSVNDNAYSKSAANRTFENGKYYQVTVNLNQAD